MLQTSSDSSARDGVNSMQWDGMLLQSGQMSHSGTILTMWTLTIATKTFIWEFLTFSTDTENDVLEFFYCNNQNPAEWPYFLGSDFAYILPAPST